jgi:NTP pyrophosphatase (non-canonical NTP hydrolase)
MQQVNPPEPAKTIFVLVALSWCAAGDSISRRINVSGTPIETTSGAGRGAHRLRAVLSGSYRRDRAGLEQAFAYLADEFDLLSPHGLGFIDPTADFVRLPDEVGQSVEEIEARHLRAISDADFVWLHAAGGHVGTSAALEIGHAQAVGTPVYTDAILSDTLLCSIVHRVDSIYEIPDITAVAPGAGLASLQSYYRRIAARRGWDEESPRDTLLLLTEEIGELARAIRKFSGITRSQGYGDTQVGEELADVQLYLTHLANTLDIDLAAAVTEKEKENARRFAVRQIA